MSQVPHGPSRSESINPAHGLETEPDRPLAANRTDGTGHQDLALRLAKALKREGDRESALQFYEHRYWLPIAERLLVDTELLDAITAYRQDRRFTTRQIQDAVMTVLDTHRVSLWLEHPQDTTTPCGSLHPEDAGHVARWVADALTGITEENGNA